MDTNSDYDHRENETNEKVDAITFGFNQKLDLEDAHEQSPRGFPPSTSAPHDEDSAAGPYCAWSKDAGFSKLWRLKEKVGRSNSDGRDAFVFLKHNDKPAATTTPKVTSSDHGIYVKVNDARGKPRVVKAKKASVSAHEAYMKSRGGHAEDDRRKSSC
ncbi:hypothetical protein CTI12_AA306450 [Artemisia annua]|uniref:Uncharacterized protein n=1 Tax=Artemisia annua TaxID=35608 RepID=A0A2U1N588_ARTAN|nr:hypothetical protein CTI12_AA306450 [Artemisia annua]